MSETKRLTSMEVDNQYASKPEVIRNRSNYPSSMNVDTAYSKTSKENNVTAQYANKPEVIRNRASYPSSMNVDTTYPKTSKESKADKQYTTSPENIRKRKVPGYKQLRTTTTYTPVATKEPVVKKAVQKAEATTVTTQDLIQEYVYLKKTYIPEIIEKTKNETVSEIKKQLPQMISDATKSATQITQTAKNEIAELKSDLQKKAKWAMIIGGALGAITIIIQIVMLMMMLKKKAD